MVKAMLSYNPYLLETKIEFNGQIPKVVLLRSLKFKRVLSELQIS